MKLILIPIIAALVIAANYLLVSKTKSEAWLAEVGYYSNISRLNLFDISQQKEEEIDLLLIGSSITGRMLPEFFSENHRVVNLGMDGGGTPSSLDFALKNADLNKVEKLIIEVNTLTSEPNKDAEHMFDVRKAFTYNLRVRLAFYRPLYRPSSVIYYKLKWRKDKQLEDSLGKRGVAFDIRESGGDSLAVERLLQSVIETGKEVILIKYPSLAQPSNDMIELFKSFAVNHHNVRYIDVPYKLSGKNLVFTDQVHLTLMSSKKVVRYLQDSLSN